MLISVILNAINLTQDIFTDVRKLMYRILVAPSILKKDNKNTKIIQQISLVVL